IAGGIGVTPFRSMVKYLSDKAEKRDIVLIYSNKIKEDIAYAEIFNNAEKVGVKTIYTLTETEKIPADWNGEKGMVSQEMIAKNIPDYKDRIFYISGPHAMVDAYENLLRQMDIMSSNIVIDYFPGFA
ncbi:MAG: FAD-dependent oxidoreductase, partial [bacterium]|nr:FAD-dependent oxidoreductase [bacterium]